MSLKCLDCLYTPENKEKENKQHIVRFKYPPEEEKYPFEKKEDNLTSSITKTYMETDADFETSLWV